MIELGHNLGLTVGGEGVESEAVLNQHAELNCDAAQGYFIMKPAPARATADWIQPRRRRALGCVQPPGPWGACVPKGCPLRDKSATL